MRRGLGRIVGAHERRERDYRGTQVTLIGAGTLISRPIDESRRTPTENKLLTTKVSQSLTFARSSSGTCWLGDIQTSHSFGF